MLAQKRAVDMTYGSYDSLNLPPSPPVPCSFFSVGFTFHHGGEKLGVVDGLAGERWVIG